MTIQKEIRWLSLALLVMSLSGCFSPSLQRGSKGPVVILPAEQSATEGAAFSPEARVVGGKPPYSYHWDFGDGTPLTDSIAAEHAYADNGIYEVTLTVSDGQGTKALGTSRVSVANVPPSVNPGGPYNGSVLSPISFSGEAADPSYLDMQSELQFSWSFGDGTEAQGRAVSHSYATSGSFTARLTVTDKDGDATSTSFAVQVNGSTTGGSCQPVNAFDDGKSPSLTLHVAANGSDSTGDGTAGRPFLSVGRAAQAVAPGTAIQIHGTYDANPGGRGKIYLENLTGTATAPIWIEGAPGATIVATANDEGMKLTRPRYVVIRNLEIYGASSNGINVDDGSAFNDFHAAEFVAFRNLKVHDITRGSDIHNCVKITGLNNFYITGGEFYHCASGGQGSGIDGVGCHDGFFLNNYFHDNTANNSIQLKGGSANVLIQGNRFANAGERAVQMGGSSNLALFRPSLQPTGNYEAKNIRTVANVFEGGAAAASFTGCVDCRFSNNTVINPAPSPSTFLVRVLQETNSTAQYGFLPTSYGRIENNIFYYKRSWLGGHFNVAAGTAPQTFSLSNNLFYNVDDPSQSGPNWDLLPADANAVIGLNPEFANASGADWRISSASPAAGRGRPLDYVPSDATGICYRNPPAMGAYEAR